MLHYDVTIPINQRKDPQAQCRASHVDVDSHIACNTSHINRTSTNSGRVCSHAATAPPADAWVVYRPEVGTKVAA